MSMDSGNGTFVHLRFPQAFILLLLLFYFFAVTTSAQNPELVTCYQRGNCSSSAPIASNITVETCCGLGDSFQQDGVGECTFCSIG